MTVLSLGHLTLGMAGRRFLVENGPIGVGTELDSVVPASRWVQQPTPATTTKTREKTDAKKADDWQQHTWKLRQQDWHVDKLPAKVVDDLEGLSEALDEKKEQRLIFATTRVDDARGAGMILSCIRFHVGLLDKLFVYRKIFDRPGLGTTGHGRHCMTEMAPLVSRQPVPTLEVCHA